MDEELGCRIFHDGNDEEKALLSCVNDEERDLHGARVYSYMRIFLIVFMFIVNLLSKEIDVSSSLPFTLFLLAYEYAYRLRTLAYIYERASHRLHLIDSNKIRPEYRAYRKSWTDQNYWNI